MFDPETFEGLLVSVRKAGWTFRRFDDSASPDPKTFFLRHDVDISPRQAAILGDIAAKLGVVSNLFFQLNAETYNFFSEETLGIIAKLRSQNHCVGLHIDQKLLGADATRIARTIGWVSDCIVEIDAVVSFHRPAPDVLGRSYHGFLNTYAEPYFHSDRYFSDSRRDPSFMERLGPALCGAGPLQLLLHPEWWYPEPDAARLAKDVIARRQGQLVRYLRTHFAKVFGTVLPDEDRDFRV